MIHAALRDLQWRSRRIGIVIAATALVFAMSLVMSGLSDSFGAETGRMLDALGGESYLAPTGEVGPFTSATIINTDKAPDAAPMLFWSAALPVGDDVKQISLIGLPVGWEVPLSSGRATEASGEVVVDSSLGMKTGETLKVGDGRYRIVGTMSGRTLFGGQPAVILTIGDAQQRLAKGAPITRAFIEKTTPSTPPPAGLVRFTRAEAAADLLRPVGSARQSISFIKVLLWLVAICIVGSAIYLSALERARDFAVFKATGVKTWKIGAGLAVQAAILAAASSLLAIGLAYLLAPRFPMPLTIPTSAVIQLPFLAIGIGLLASLAGLRRTIAADPSQAFGGR